MFLNLHDTQSKSLDNVFVSSSTLKGFLDTHIKNAFGGIDRSFIEAALFKALVIRRNGCGNMQLSHAHCRQGSTVNKPACIFEPFSLVDVVFCCSIRSFYELTFIYYGFFIDGPPFFFLSWWASIT